MESKVITVEPIQTTEAIRANEDAITLFNQAKEVAITTQPEYDIAGTLLQKIKGREKEIESKRKEITRPLDVAKKAVMDLFRAPLEKLGIAEGNIKPGMVTFDEKQEKIRREHQEKLDRQAKVEEDRKKKDLEKRAKKAEENGKAEKAEELREQKEATHIEAPLVAPRIEKPKGISYITRWSAEVIDKSKLPLEYLEPNYSMLNKLAQATKGKIPIAGVKFNSEKIVASRSK